MSDSKLHHPMVCVGKFWKNFRLIGEIKVSFLYSVRSLDSCKTIFYQDKLQDNYLPLMIQSIKYFQQNWLVLFKGLTTPESVKHLNGLSLWLSEKQAESYFDYSITSPLIGFEVFDENSNLLGVVDRIQSSPAQDLLVVTGIDKMEKLIPNIVEFVLKVEIENKCIIIDFAILRELYYEN